MRNTNWYLVGGILVVVLGALLYLMNQPDFMQKKAEMAGEVATSMETETEGIEGDDDDGDGDGGEFSGMGEEEMMTDVDPEGGDDDGGDEGLE